MEIQRLLMHENWINENHDYDRRTKIKWNYPIELCKYSSNHETRYTLAYFVHDENGYELKEDCLNDEIGEIWKQLKEAQKMLDAYHEATYCENE